MSLPIVRNLVSRNIARRGLKPRSSSDYAPAHHEKPVTMDDLPVPSGSWQEYHNKQQAKYNRHLILGLGFTAFTLVVVKASGLIFFNWSPPPYPEEPPKEE